MARGEDRGGGGRRQAPAVLCAADVLVALDSTDGERRAAVDPGDLGFSTTALRWVVTGYTVALGSLLASVAGAPAPLVGARVVAGLGPRSPSPRRSRSSPRPSAKIPSARARWGPSRSASTSAWCSARYSAAS
jgi:hypothetical protein